MSLMGFRKRTMGEQDKLLIRLQTLHYCDCMLSNNTSAHTDGTNLRSKSIEDSTVIEIKYRVRNKGTFERDQNTNMTSQLYIGFVALHGEVSICIWFAVTPTVIAFICILCVCFICI